MQPWVNYLFARVGSAGPNLLDHKHYAEQGGSISGWWFLLEAFITPTGTAESPN
jgi:hypothetical protein